MFLALSIKGVYDYGLDSKNSQSAYLRFNFLCALMDSSMLIIIWRVNTRIIQFLGTLAALFFVLLMG
jgi:hypothetical protein